MWQLQAYGAQCACTDMTIGKNSAVAYAPMPWWLLTCIVASTEDGHKWLAIVAAPARLRVFRGSPTSYSNCWLGAL